MERVPYVRTYVMMAQALRDTSEARRLLRTQYCRGETDKDDKLNGAGFDLAFVCAFEWAVRLSSCKGGSSKGKPLEISSFSRDP